MGILVTAKGAVVWADGTKRVIEFPPISNWVEVDDRLARARGPERIAPPDFEERIASFKSGAIVDLARGGQIRAGCGIPLVVNGQLAFGKFDPTHPTRGDHLTPPAGLFRLGTPWEAAGDELSEELLVLGSRLSEEFLVRTANKVGVWRIFGMQVNGQRAEEYARLHSLHFDPEFVFEVERIPEFPFQTQVRFGEAEWLCLVEFEADSSSIELLFPGRVTLPVGWWLVDGERLPDGRWRAQPVITEGYEEYPQTTKAQIALRALSGL